MERGIMGIYFDKYSAVSGRYIVCGVALLLCRPAECLGYCFVCTKTLQASGKASAKIREWNVEFGCGIWPYKIKHSVPYLAILCGVLPRNHRKKTICSLHREGNTGKGHSKENRTKAFHSRLYCSSIWAEKIRMLRGLIEKSEPLTFLFHAVTCLHSPPHQLCIPKYWKSMSYYRSSWISSLCKK